MNARRISLVLVAVFLWPPLATWAHSHRAGFAAGARLTERSDLWGAGIGLDFPLYCKSRESALCKSLSVSAVVSVFQVSGDHAGGELTQREVVFGPRFAYNRWKWGQPFAEVLVGTAGEKLVSQESRSAGFDWSTTGSFGAGVDIPFIKLEGGEFILRGQYNLSWISAEELKWFDQWSASIGFQF